jgi:hypothetical protein
MDVSFYLLSLAVIPLFAARGALPLLCMVLLAEYYLYLEYLGLDTDNLSTQLIDPIGLLLLDTSLHESLATTPLALVTTLPEWLTSPTSIGVLCILSIIEHIYNKSPDIRELFPFGESELKGMFAATLCFSLVGGNIEDLVLHFKEVGVSSDFGGFFSIEYAWSFFIGCLTWFVSSLRNGVYFLLTEMDPMDEIGIRKLLSFIETSLGIFGPLFVVIMPFVAVSLAGFAVLILYLVKHQLEKREAKEYRACMNCSHENHLCAPNCGQCNTVIETPFAVGLFGQAIETPVTNLEQHKLALIENKRCSYCAERSKEKALDIVCEVCNKPFFDDIEKIDSYLAHLRRKLPKTLLVTAIFSAIPIIGIVPGILYYRLTLISGLRMYLPRVSNFWARWFVRIGGLVLLCFQWIPGLGIISLPLMCLLNYGVYSSSFKRQREKLNLKKSGREAQGDQIQSSGFSPK